MLTIQVIHEGRELAQCSHGSHAQLYVKQSYPEGCALRFTAPKGHLWVQPDHTFAPALVYLPSGEFTYRLPLADEPRIHPPFAFAGEMHLIRAWLPEKEEPQRRRNIALNPADQRGESSAYPHATANVETRNEAQFAARNAIDGFTIADYHGSWPYQSWGIWERADAWLKVDFGREILADGMALMLRADFPHDAYWTSATAVFSDGSEQTVSLSRTGERQAFSFSQRRVSWARLERLVKSVEPSVFPALIEWEIFGKDI